MDMIFKILLTCLILALSSPAYADNENLRNSSTIIANQPIDINNADIQTLVLLKGIGKKKATAIIEYRESNGKFNSVDDLLHVDGIGKHVLSMNKAKLTI